MTANGWVQIIFYCVVLFAITKPMGIYMLKVYDGSYRWLGFLERPIYRICGIDEKEDQHWTDYAAGLLLFSVASMLVTYLVLRLQGALPLNPEHFPGVVDRQAFETSGLSKKHRGIIASLARNRSRLNLPAEYDEFLSLYLS